MGITEAEAAAEFFPRQATRRRVGDGNHGRRETATRPLTSPSKGAHGRFDTIHASIRAYFLETIDVPFLGAQHDR